MCGCTKKYFLITIPLYVRTTYCNFLFRCSNILGANTKQYEPYLYYYVRYWQQPKRQKVADLLERFGYERLQLSVFTGLQPPYNNTALWKMLNKLIDNTNYPNDKICCIAVSRPGFERMKTIGTVGVDVEYLLGKKLVIIF